MTVIPKFEFGDIEDADSADTATPEALPTARIYQNFRNAVHDELLFEELSDEEKALLTYVFAVIISIHWMLTAESGAMIIVTLSRKLSGDPNRPYWSTLSRRDRARSIAMADYILKRLARETGIEWDRD